MQFAMWLLLDFFFPLLFPIFTPFSPFYLVMREVTLFEDFFGLTGYGAWSFVLDLWLFCRDAGTYISSSFPPKTKVIHQLTNYPQDRGICYEGTSSKRSCYLE